MADQPARLEAATVRAEIGSGIVYHFANDAANEADIPTLSGDIPNLKKIILQIQTDGANKISFATKIFATTAAGIAGTSNQEIFLVQSSDPDEIYAVWQNVSGSAVDTGKRSLSATAVIAATEAATQAAATAQTAADQATARTARFILPRSSDPTQRDDGTAIQVGDTYFNTTNQQNYTYENTGWQVSSISGSYLSDPQGASRVSTAGSGTVQTFIDSYAAGLDSVRISLVSQGGTYLGGYAASLNVSSYNHFFYKDGQFWKALSTTALPYSTTGNWSSERVLFGSATGASDLYELKKPTGATRIGFSNYTVDARLLERRSPKEFAVPGQSNWNSAFANMMTYLRGFPGTPPVIEWPNEIFEYSVSPNWACHFSNHEFGGATRLRYSGTGDGFIIDGNIFPAMNGVFCMRMHGLIYEGPSNSMNGIKCSATHHCDFGFKVDGCGVGYAAIDMNFGVCTILHRPEVSVNSAGTGTSGAWYKGANGISAKPMIGIRLNQRNLGEQMAYCTIETPIVEGTDIGLQGLAMLGTSVLRGTLEGCTNVGLSLGTGCLRNVLNHIDFEVNVNADIFNSGAANKFIDIDGDGLSVMNAGEFNRISGGNVKSFTINSGCTRTIVRDLVYNRANDGGLFTDNGIRTRLRDIQDAFEGFVHDAKPAVVSVIVTASPFTYTNTTGNPVCLYVLPGTSVISSIERRRFGLSFFDIGAIRGEVRVCAGDDVRITYTGSAPTAYTVTD